MKRDGGQLWHPVADQTSFYDSFLTLQVVKGHSLPNKMQRKMLVSHDTEEHLFSIDIVIRKLGYKVVINSGFGGLFRSATLLLAWLLRTSRLDWCNSDSRFPWAPALLLLTSLLRIDIVAGTSFVFTTLFRRPGFLFGLSGAVALSWICVLVGFDGAAFGAGEYRKTTATYQYRSLAAPALSPSTSKESSFKRSMATMLESRRAAWRLSSLMALVVTA